MITIICNINRISALVENDLIEGLFFVAVIVVIAVIVGSEIYKALSRR